MKADYPGRGPAALLQESSSEPAPRSAASEAGRGAAIHAAHLSKRFGQVQAVIDLNLDVGLGEVIGFLGPNGAGKTTTIRLLMGFINPSAGFCSVLGVPLREGVAMRRRVGYLPGDFRMDPAMSGHDLFQWFGRLRGGVDQHRIDELTDRLRLDPRQPFGVLSKGNRQKVGIVQGFMNDPKVLILDEPTSGLDPLLQRELLGLVQSAASGGAAVLFSSHILPEVERSASRVAIIRSGMLVAVSTVDELLDHAVHHLELRYADPVPPDLFEAVPGVETVGVDGRRVVVTIRGPAGPAMKVASSHPGLLRVTNASDDLEDLFVKLYAPQAEA